MLICKFCNFCAKSKLSLSKHISCFHQIKDAKTIIFGWYPELFSYCLNCGIRIKKYPTDGGTKCCSDNCSYQILKSKNKGKKQTKERIQNRVEKTNQKLKETNRQKTMLEKYGNLFHTENPEDRSNKISKALSNKSHTKEHHEKIIESKRNNNTLKHTKETRNKIADNIKNYWQDNNIDHSVVIPKNGKGGKGYKTGYYNDIWYRSSYEKEFLRLCETFNIKVESAATKKFRVKYFYEGKYRYYYPDFYLPEYDLVCEIKPLSLLGEELVEQKLINGATKFKYWLVTEEELNDKDFFQTLQYF